MVVDGKPVRDYPRLRGAATHLTHPDEQHMGDVLKRLGLGLAGGLGVALLATSVLSACLARRTGSASEAAGQLLGGHADIPWRAMAVTFTLLCLTAGALAGLSSMP
ncbi:hypothetical protein G6F55_014249 [Rhizopus delemar]|nr:hypothetical protein G6F55_014249 [Rhizopus delemar]